MLTAFSRVLPGLAAAALGATFCPPTAEAKVAQVADTGFVIQHVQAVSASPAEVWQALLRPAKWWDSDHTWSGDAANLAIDPRAGGCFCEVLPNKDSPRAAPWGTVEHMRVVYVEEPRVLRMVGALGPLQGDAITATLTFQLKASGTGTAILMEYVVGGYSKVPMAQLSTGVDGMLGQQLEHLAGLFGGARPAPAGAKAKEPGKVKAKPVPADVAQDTPAPRIEPEATADQPADGAVPDLFALPGDPALADGTPTDSGSDTGSDATVGNPNLPSGR